MGKIKAEKPTLTPAQRTIRRTRQVLTGGRWFLITGLVFYSLMTTTPFVSAHSAWHWSGFVLGLIVDAAFIMSLSAESTLARYGVTKLGRWPVAFRWFTGLSSVFLNVWVSVSHGDWVGVAVHLIAPALVMLLAEVGPLYMAALADAERKATKTDAFAERYANVAKTGSPIVLPVTDHEPIVARSAYPAEPEPVNEPEPVQPTLPDDDDLTALLDAVTEPERTNELHDAEPEPEPARLSNKEADEIIEKGWRHKLSPEEVGKAATRHPATVRRKYKELDAALSV
jgi:hypothetical protein